MSKKLIIASIVVTLFASVLLFSANKKDEMWKKAITEKDTKLRFDYLKEYEALYGEKKDKVARYLYLNLANAAYKLQNFDETIKYGEEALTFDETDAEISAIGGCDFKPLWTSTRMARSLLPSMSTSTASHRAG